MLCDFTKGCSVWLFSKRLEIHICRICKRQIVFVVNDDYKCPVCLKKFDDGHSLAIHWHYMEKSQCDFTVEDTFLQYFPYRPAEEREKEECIRMRRHSSD